MAGGLDISRSSCENSDDSLLVAAATVGGRAAATGPVCTHTTEAESQHRVRDLGVHAAAPGASEPSPDF